MRSLNLSFLSKAKLDRIMYEWMNSDFLYFLFLSFAHHHSMYSALSSSSTTIINYPVCRKNFLLIILSPLRRNCFIRIDDWLCEGELHRKSESINTFTPRSIRFHHEQMCEIINSLVDDIILVCYQIWSIDTTGCVHSWQNLWTYCQRLSLVSIHLTFLPSPLSSPFVCT